jgi:HK97 family phage major capsid protein
MAETITNGTKIALYGDFSRYLIVDRVGLTVEVVQHVFGANQRPTGQRGLYAYWRNGAKVLDANAFRALTGTT